MDITDFWRVGKGYAKKLKEYGMYTMRDGARCSVDAPNSYRNENLLYKLLGVNTELLIDHACDWEPCTIEEIKKYCPETNNSLSIFIMLSSSAANAPLQLFYSRPQRACRFDYSQNVGKYVCGFQRNQYGSILTHIILRYGSQLQAVK